MLYKIHLDELYREKHPFKADRGEGAYNKRVMLCIGITVYALGTLMFLSVGYCIKQVILPDKHHLKYFDP
jgi:hypothetical protein